MYFSDLAVDVANPTGDTLRADLQRLLRSEELCDVFIECAGEPSNTVLQTSNTVATAATTATISDSAMTSSPLVHSSGPVTESASSDIIERTPVLTTSSPRSAAQLDPVSVIQHMSPVPLSLCTTGLSASFSPMPTPLSSQAQMTLRHLMKESKGSSTLSTPPSCSTVQSSSIKADSTAGLSALTGNCGIFNGGYVKAHSSILKARSSVLCERILHLQQQLVLQNQKSSVQQSHSRFTFSPLPISTGSSSSTIESATATVTASTSDSLLQSSFHSYISTSFPCSAAHSSMLAATTTEDTTGESGSPSTALPDKKRQRLSYHCTLFALIVVSDFFIHLCHTLVQLCVQHRILLHPLRNHRHHPLLHCHSRVLQHLHARWPKKKLII